MTDETNKPGDSTANDPKEAAATSAKRNIMIGSQRAEDAAPAAPAAKPVATPPNPAAASAGDSPGPKAQADSSPDKATTAEQPASASAEAAAQPTKPATPVRVTPFPGGVSSTHAGSASAGGDAPTTPSLPTAQKPKTAEQLFPASIIDQVTGNMDDEIEAAMGDLAIDDLMADAGSAATGVELDKRYPARVIKVDRESVFFAFAGQFEGIAPQRMFDEPLEPGAELEVVPTRFLTDEGLYEVVVPGASVEIQDWSDLAEGVVVEAKVTGHNKGGLECEVNRIRGFMPISHIELFRVDDLEQYVGQSIQAIVTEANESRRNLVLSRRALLEREREAKREELLESLAEGQTLEGVVTRLQDFGAFVDLGGIDGLIHVSQLSWDRIQHPREVLEEGQKVQVRIEKLDVAAGRIGLSYRDLLEDPWDGADAKFEVNSIVDGTVSKIMDFGAFVRLASGIEGLVHISEIANHRITKVGAFLNEGDEVKVKVLSVDLDSQRISLSIKGAQASPAKESETEAEEPELRKSVVPQRSGPLKGGLNRPSGGEDVGLKW